ncbi:MAG: PKD domain-containing protein, partial [Methanomicrobiales archaeon]|nr:PKD domain-containing protein [Methanomicrobiales archaeon]
MRSRPPSQVSSRLRPVLSFCCLTALLCSFILLPAAAAGTETRISNGDGSQDDPRISGNWIVWVEKSTDYDIVLYDIGSGTSTVFNGGTMQDYARIDGDYAVWQGDRYIEESQSHNSDIYLLHIPSKTVTRLNNDQWDFQYYPDISGDRVVWVDDRNRLANRSQWDIYLYQISTQAETRITTDSWDQSRPAVNGNYVVMEEYQYGSANISLYDISTGLLTPLVTAASSQQKPRIDGNYVVYQDSRNGVPEIYLMDLATRQETQITSHASGTLLPEIDRDRIVWTDYRNGNADIYLYNITSGRETRITSDPYTQFSPDISGDRIVWMDNRDGDHNLYAIYLYTMDGVPGPTPTPTPTPTPDPDPDGDGDPTPPEAEFTSDVRTGTAPLTVHFTDQTTGTGPFTYSWDFQNNGSEDSTLKDPTFIYPIAGTYTVKLTATGPGGTNSETRDQYITVNPAPETLVMTTSTASTYTYLGYTSTYLKQAQSFRAADTGVSRIAVALARRGTPAMDILLSVRSTLKGADLASTTIAASQVTSTDYRTPTWVEVPLDLRGQLTKGQVCYIVLSVPTYSSRNCFLVPLNGNNPFKEGSLYKNTVLSQAASSEMLMKVWFTDGVILPTPPDAQFTSDVRTGTAPLTVHFTDQTTGTGPFTYSWDFQNNGSEDSSLKDPTFIYLTAGTYTVKLTVTGP